MFQNRLPISLNDAFFEKYRLLTFKNSKKDKRAVCWWLNYFIPRTDSEDTNFLRMSTL